MQMGMGIDKTGNHRATVQIDAPGRSGRRATSTSALRPTLRILPSRTAIAWAMTKVRIDGNDLAVVQHQVRVTDHLGGKRLRQRSVAQGEYSGDHAHENLSCRLSDESHR